MPTFHCSKCADRAAAYRLRALQRLPQAKLTLDLLRQRLQAAPKTASVRVQDPLPQDMTSLLLTVQDLNRILARGQAISTIVDKAREGYWLTIRLVAGDEESREHAYHLVLHYLWPPTPRPDAWVVVATNVFEPDERYDSDGYPLCWCERPIRPGGDDDAV